MGKKSALNYRILKTGETEFSRAIDDLLDQGAAIGGIPVRTVFFAGADSSREYARLYDLIREKTTDRFPKQTPLFSLVGQPLAENGILAAEVHTLDASCAGQLRHETQEAIPYSVWENRDWKMLHFSGSARQFDALDDLSGAAEAIFGALGDILQKENMPVESLIRQWNYIERITGKEKTEQRYQIFNDKRGDFYARGHWREGYPAATGIGMAQGGLVVDALAFAAKDGRSASFPLDSPFQIPAHRYSEKVLAASRAEGGARTPKFERGRLLSLQGELRGFISGTAAIRAEGSLCPGDPEGQTRITLENIAALIGTDNFPDDRRIGKAELTPQILRIYLKDRELLEKTRPLVEEFYPQAQKLYLEADICRDELLMEIEGIAG